MSSIRPERIIAGEVASGGVAIGRIALHRVDRALVARAGTPSEERIRFEAAVAAATGKLAALMGRADQAGAEILEFQLALLEDAELLEPVRRRVAAGEAAFGAWRAVMAGMIAEYEAAPDEHFRARAADLADLRDRIADLIAGIDESPIVGSDEAIYVAAELGPSRFLEIDWAKFRGAALLQGSSASHVAILARARGVPLIVGLDGAQLLIDGASAILDAEGGRLIQDPAPTTRQHYAARIAADTATAAEHARYLAKPAVTRGGESVRIYINVDDPRLLRGIDPSSCDGIGLTRTEFLFHGGRGLPDEAAQTAAYGALLDWADGRPVTIRTLDAGGDKPIPGLTPEGESNPFLGLRGLRLSLARPEVFRVQLRALARVAVRGKLKVMLPMVTRPEELEQTRALMREEIAALGAAGLPAAMPSLGIMVEVPAAALNIGAFAADFYSIGSNDLTQYVTATSRDCSAVRALHDPLDPGVIELIRRVAAHGRATGREVSLCGDMASDPRCLGALLATGLRVLSVAPAKLARIKAEIATYG